MSKVIFAAIVLLLSQTLSLTAAPLDDAVAAAHSGDYALAYRLLRPLAEDGDARAQFNLGYMIAHGWGVPQDDATAVGWYRKAADQGLPIAQHYLGMAYAYGDGVAVDDAEAVRWYRRAADQGFSSAQFWLGIAFDRGIGTEHDAVAAYVWISLAAQRGVSPGEVLPALARALTPEQRADAQKRVGEWRPRAEAGPGVSDARPQELLGTDPHIGEFADPSVWPISAIGAVTVAFYDRREACTGALVGPRLVLTAAHCLYHGRRLAPAGSVRFLAGMRRGKPASVSVAERLVVSRSYWPDDWSSNAAANDWGLIVLKDALPVRPLTVRALGREQLHSLSGSGAVSHVGYGKERPYSPSILHHCRLDPAADGRTFVFRCLMNFGYSGSPILADIDGAPAIIGIVSRGSQQLLQGIACSASQFEAEVRDATAAEPRAH